MKVKYFFKPKFKVIVLSILFLTIFFSLVLSKNLETYSASNTALQNTTRMFFCAGIMTDGAAADSILVVNYDENGNKLFGLIDTGFKNESVLTSYLQNHGVTKKQGLDFLTITHAHEDHIGNTIEVLNTFPVKRIYIQEDDPEWSIIKYNDYKNILQIAIKKNIEVIGVTYDGLFSEVISPTLSSAFNTYVNEEYINNLINTDLTNIAKKNELKETLVSLYGKGRDSYIENIINILSQKNLNTSEIAKLKTELKTKLHERLKTQFKGFDKNNTKFQFGSSNVQIFNWELFDVKGNLYNREKHKNDVKDKKIQSAESIYAREHILGGNNNSLVFLFTQGKKKALLTGDLNNLDKSRSYKHR